MTFPVLPEPDDTGEYDEEAVRATQEAAQEVFDEAKQVLGRLGVHVEGMNLIGELHTERGGDAHPGVVFTALIGDKAWSSAVQNPAADEALRELDLGGLEFDVLREQLLDQYGSTDGTRTDSSDGDDHPADGHDHG